MLKLIKFNTDEGVFYLNPEQIESIIQKDDATKIAVKGSDGAYFVPMTVSEVIEVVGRAVNLEIVEDTDKEGK